ncbi:NUDIX hydrolase [Paenibacillus sp. TC-CSREp1]|uniref:NUDIX hydrolase n=1 Tax=Paenibacillus sp. TC-CSREp1 TaxID=3410089 RepID=UPI003D048A31
MTQERFDIYDNQQQWIGTAPRSEVHARGYWHRSFHCWIVRDEGNTRMVLFQRRRDIKDTFPGYYDITAAGHLAAGEQLQDASRELEEELGACTPFDALTYLLTAEQQLQGEVRGVPFIDREISSVYGLCLNQPLESYVLQASEVDSLFEAPLDELLALFRQETDVVRASGIRPKVSALKPEGTAPSNAVHFNRSGHKPFANSARIISDVRATDFVPHGTKYYMDVLEALKRVQRT